MAKVSRKNKAKKQRQAVERFKRAREEGLEAVALEAVLGNQYSRQVAKGYLLEDGVEAFKLTDDEAELCRVLQLNLEAQDPEGRAWDEKRLRSGEYSVRNYLSIRESQDAISRLMNLMVIEAHAKGEITTEEFVQIRASRKL